MTGGSSGASAPTRVDTGHGGDGQGLTTVCEDDLLPGTHALRLEAPPLEATGR